MFDNTDGYSFTLPQKHKIAEGPNEFGVTIPLRDSNCTGGPPAGNGCCRTQCGSNCDSCAVELALDGGPDDKKHIASRVAMIVSRYKHGSEHVMFTFGSDFQFQDAPAPFVAIEACMKYVAANPDKYPFELVYSTPADYFAAIGAPGFGETAAAEQRAKLEDWPVFDSDFLPAAFSEHYIRSGFYTSRPASKASDRVAWMASNAAKSLEVLASVRQSTQLAMLLPPANLTSLAVAISAADAAVGVHQHHDGLTGTDLAAVALNYANMIANASTLVAAAAAATAAMLVGLPSEGASGCTESNVSVCLATAPLQQKKSISVVLYNPLAASRTEVVAVPVPVSSVEVVGGSGEAVPHEVHPSIMADAKRGYAWTLFIKADLKPLETMLLTLRPPAKGSERLPVAAEPAASVSGVFSLHVETGASVAVDANTGMLLSISDQVVNCSLAFYTPAVGSNKSHGWGNTDDCSTAYAFRPMPGVPKQDYGPATNPPKVYRGVLVQQTHVVVDEASGIELAVRVVAGDTSVQLISQLGPLDVSNGFGQEAVIELKAPIDSGAQWQTDANGLFMMHRTRRTNSSGFFPGYVVAEPEAQNYFPATTMAELHSAAEDGPAFAVSFASSHGVTSLAPGTLEVMMHRRFVDHGCRVDQGYQMNDTYRIIKTLRLRALPSSKGLAVANRLDSRNTHHPVAVFFAAASPGPAPPPGNNCSAAMHSVCGTAAGGGPVCIRCCGEHETQLAADGCSKADYESFCDGAPAPPCGRAGKPPAYGNCNSTKNCCPGLSCDSTVLGFYCDLAPPSQPAPPAPPGAATMDYQPPAAPQELPPSVHLHTFRTSLGADLRCSPFPPRQCDAPAAGNDGSMELLVRLQHLFSAGCVTRDSNSTYHPSCFV